MCNITLFQPDPAAAAHSDMLQDRIRSAIRDEGGSLSFARFMQMALYEPGLGYYSAGLSKFGSAGDFVTAPEISPLFGHCFARQISEIFSQLNNPVLLELGAGSGRLACDLLRKLEHLHQLPEHYLILEVSADLRQRQKQLINAELPHLSDRVIWLDRLPEKKLNGVILANEVLDAMPVQLFRIGESLEERRVAIAHEQFCFINAAASDQLRKSVQVVQEYLTEPLPPGYISELNPHLDAWFAGLTDCLNRGVILCVDYGYSCREYYHPQRNNGTLICHYRHQVNDDPFALIGLQDITASVDFTAVAEAGVKNDLTLTGYTSQAFFLMNSGLLEILNEIQETDPDRYLKSTQEAKTLTLPGEMGERFRVIAFAQNFDQRLSGFHNGDHRDRL